MYNFLENTNLLETYLCFDLVGNCFQLHFLWRPNKKLLLLRCIEISVNILMDGDLCKVFKPPHYFHFTTNGIPLLDAGIFMAYLIDSLSTSKYFRLTCNRCSLHSIPVHRANLSLDLMRHSMIHWNHFLHHTLIVTLLINQQNIIFLLTKQWNLNKKKTHKLSSTR